MTTSDIHGPRPAGQSFFTVVLAAAAMRVALLAAFGPRPSYDSIHQYVPYADLIRTGTSWMSDAGLAHVAVPITTFRMVGYPALIALAQILAGERWPWLMVAIQIAATMIAIVMVMLLAGTLAPRSRWVPMAAGLCTAFGQTLSSDITIETDSLSAAALICFAALSARGALDRRALGPSGALGLGLLPAASFLLRENTDATVLTLLPLALAWALRSAPSPGRRWWLMALVVAPLIACNIAQVTWNDYRTGSGFLTTGRQIILLQALMHAAWTGEPVLDGGSLMDQAAQGVLSAKAHPDGFLAQEELWSVNQRLFDSGQDAVQIARQMTAAYGRAWLRHPAGMLRASLSNLSAELFLVLGNAVRPDIGEVLLQPPRQAPTDAGQAAAFASFWAVALGLCATTLALSAVSLAVTAGFLLSPPVAIYLALARRRPLDAADWFRIYVLAAMLAFLSLHIVVHFENRFLAPIEPLAIVSGLTGIAAAWGWLRRASA